MTPDGRAIQAEVLARYKADQELEKHVAKLWDAIKELRSKVHKLETTGEHG